MTVKVLVRQFKFGNQGEINEIKTITRKLHTSSFYGPEYSFGCCSPIVKKQTYQWVAFEGLKYKVQEHWSKNHDDIHFEINLPGK